MASLPISNDDNAPSVLFISPLDIHVGDRIGMFWPDKAAALGKLIAADGQHDPIKVRRNGNRAKQPWSLVTGLHRLEGVKLEGLAHVEAIQVFGNEDTLLEIQASENVHRRELPPLERACFVHAIAQAAERRMQAEHGELSQQQIAIRSRWEAERQRAQGVKTVEQRAELEADHTAVNLSAVYGWQENVAGALGLSTRAVRRDLALYRAIVEPFPQLAHDLARHPVVGENASALREIAAVADERSRGKIISCLIQYPALTVDGAKVQLGFEVEGAKAPATGATKFMNGVSSNLQRLSAGDQASIAADIVNNFKPSALVALRDAVNARLAKGDGK